MLAKAKGHKFLKKILNVKARFQKWQGVNSHFGLLVYHNIMFSSKRENIDITEEFGIFELSGAVTTL